MMRSERPAVCVRLAHNCERGCFTGLRIGIAGNAQHEPEGVRRVANRMQREMIAEARAILF
eukprot:5365011-Prymnesium_polylepis.1